MYCSKCGTENDNNSKYCAECGAELIQISAPIQQQSVNKSNKETNNAYQPQNVGNQKQTAVYPVKRKKFSLPIIIAVVVIVAVIALALWIVSFPHLSVSDVKKGTLIGYESKTIGKAFEDYFNDCSWEAFTAAEDDSISVVKFIGSIDGYDGKIRVTVEFTHDSNYQREKEFGIYIVKITYANGEYTSLPDYKIPKLINSIYNDLNITEWL